MWEQGRFVRVGKMRCVATGRPVAQDHAEEPRGNLMNFRGAFSDAGCRLLAYRVVSRQRSNSVAFRVKRTLSRIYEYTPLANLEPLRIDLASQFGVVAEASVLI